MKHTVVAFLALLVVLSSSFTTTANAAFVNCTTDVMNAPNQLYDPGQACISADAGISRCITSFHECTAVADSCKVINVCIDSKLRCLEGTNPSASICNGWSSGLKNTMLYLASGGFYNESSLYTNCLGIRCFDLWNATKNTNLTCPVDSEDCTAPDFNPPSQRPDQVKFSVTFAGDWTTILANAVKGSAEYEKLVVAVSKGLATVLNTFEHLIEIVDMRSGSLIVDFLVSDTSLSLDAISAKLQSYLDNPDAVAPNAFAELESVSGIKIEITSFGVDDPANPPVEEERDACGSGCKAGVAIGVIVGVSLIAFIIVIVITKKAPTDRTQEKENDEEEMGEPTNEPIA